MTYDLVEIFESLQGEGRNMGRVCLFVLPAAISPVRGVIRMSQSAFP